jgi:hypothetical protein
LFLSYKSETGKSFNWRTYLTEVDEIRRKNSSENVSNGRESNTNPTIQEGKSPSGPSVVIYAAERLLDEWSLSTIGTDGGCSQIVISANAKEKDCPEDPLSPAMAAPKLETVSKRKRPSQVGLLPKYRSLRVATLALDGKLRLDEQLTDRPSDESSQSSRDGEQRRQKHDGPKGCDH